MNKNRPRENQRFLLEYRMPRTDVQDKRVARRQVAEELLRQRLFKHDEKTRAKGG